MKIRAFTFFAKELSEVEKAETTLAGIEREDIWTKRISFPPTPKDMTLDKVSEIPSMKDVIYSVASLTANDSRLKEVKDILSVSDNFYVNVLLREEKDIEATLNLVLSLEPEQATRFGILFNDWFLVSPYFPISTADVATSSFGLALLYTDEAMSGNIVKVFSAADEIGRELEKELKVKYLGTDLSLSPWMEKSVGEIIEKRSDTMFNISNIWAVHEINREITESAILSKVKPLGFSELMLPVAEDNLLRERAEEGKLTLKELLELTFVCAAGIDMISLRRDRKTFLDLIKALYSIRLTKMRPIGMRIVPSNGEKVHVKEFGDIPEVKVI
ncbi:DUF711 family protein [Sulfuracidifex tepidarius]|uniref:DUF711 domain-containing protein n=1 Tax=Sulfuracidifex tepidarius TaxID=1294262 RepID=A0A510E2F5_9CREN|nr:DUF711 family protein [Sulfuracidifex tepidarius]BBG23917.1 hypothetical protein IC006_1215 [Sulfuracidifex tepidarius]BBG26672.1 hypothetical protein IC007_1190 [Sulfuracidifex tepidarius]